jgi:hypothetical protein
MGGRSDEAARPFFSVKGKWQMAMDISASAGNRPSLNVPVEATINPVPVM